MKSDKCTRQVPGQPNAIALNYNMKRFQLLLIFWLIASGSLIAQIWEPEGLNLPGQWNGWQNPPVNNLALASSTQVQGGRVVKINQGIVRWQTIFSVAATGADLVGGTHNWLFTSGPAASPWANKWAGVTVQINTLQNYTFNNGPDNSATLTNGKWYTVNWEDKGYMNSRAIFMETSAQPVQLMAVSVPSGIVAGQSATVDVLLSAAPSAGELIHLRHISNALASTCLISVPAGTSAGKTKNHHQPECSAAHYYALTPRLPTLPTISAS